MYLPAQTSLSSQWWPRTGTQLPVSLYNIWPCGLEGLLLLVVHSFIQTIITVQLSSHSRNLTEHYFCDVHSLVQLKTHCGGQQLVWCCLDPLSLLCHSYVILLSLQKHSLEGKHRVLSTCDSYVTVVIFSSLPSSSTYSLPPLYWGQEGGCVLHPHWTLWLTPEKNGSEECHEEDVDQNVVQQK